MSASGESERASGRANGQDPYASILRNLYLPEDSWHEYELAARQKGGRKQPFGGGGRSGGAAKDEGLPPDCLDFRKFKELMGE